MAYDRYDHDDSHRRENYRRDERSDREWFGGDRQRDDYRGRDERDERGFFERAGDQISSWFGDDGREDHRSPRRHDHGRDRGIWRSGTDGQNRNDDRRSDFDSDRDRGRERGWSSDRDDRGYGRSIWSDGRRDDYERDRSDDRHSRGSSGYRPVTGDYGRGGDHRSEQFFAASGVGRGQRGFGGYDRDERERGRAGGGGDERSRSPYGRDDFRRTSFAGSRSEGHERDPNFRNWRDRHMSEIDRDYDDYRRENESRFEDDFAGWRGRREEKRRLLAIVREHMEVVGRDEKHVGTVDKVAGDRIILTKSDRDSGGDHHSLNCSAIDRVEGNRIILDCSAAEARDSWRNEDRGRALFESRDQRDQDGPHVLDRSFSGTYRDR